MQTKLTYMSAIQKNMESIDLIKRVGCYKTRFRRLTYSAIHLADNREKSRTIFLSHISIIMRTSVNFQINKIIESYTVEIQILNKLLVSLIMMLFIIIPRMVQ